MNTPKLAFIQIIQKLDAVASTPKTCCNFSHVQINFLRNFPHLPLIKLQTLLEMFSQARADLEHALPSENTKAAVNSLKPQNLYETERCAKGNDLKHLKVFAF